jgi:hypothetical protein
MRIDIRADDGDEVSISADVISIEQALITVEIQNSLYTDYDHDSLKLTVEKARELAAALLSVADAIEFVTTPVISHNLGRSHHPMGKAQQA